ncbi:MAG: hypothetical protein KBB83_06870 [Alphaproteobacteria bacterium]|nr:hypothetical protein [Alphaproteobacteria bacterium]
MINFMNIYRYAILLVFCPIISNLHATNTPAVNDIEDIIRVTRVTTKQEIEEIKELLGERYRFSDEDLSRTRYNHWGEFKCVLRTNPLEDGPFGVFKITRGNQLLGVQKIGFALRLKDSLILAAPMTDIADAFQGRGYGKILRTEVARHVGKYIGSNIAFCRTEIKPDSNEEPQWETLPLVAMKSCVEWYSGRNGNSLRTALVADYGIKNLKYSYRHLHVSTCYPRNPSLWSDRRIDILMQISRLNSENPRPESIPLYIELLQDLDLTQDNDIETLNSISLYMESSFQDNLACERLNQFFQDLPTDLIKGVLNRIQSEKPTIEQRIFPFTGVHKFKPHRVLELKNKLQSLLEKR